MRINAGHRLVITFPRRLRVDEAEYVASKLRQRLRLDTAVNPIVVLDDGATAVVIKGPNASSARHEEAT